MRLSRFQALDDTQRQLKEDELAEKFYLQLLEKADRAKEPFPPPPPVIAQPNVTAELD